MLPNNFVFIDPYIILIYCVFFLILAYHAQLHNFTIVIVLKHILTSTVILITCVVGIPLFMIKKTEYQQLLYCHKTTNFGVGCWYSVFLINHKQWNTIKSIIQLLLVYGLLQ